MEVRFFDLSRMSGSERAALYVRSGVNVSNLIPKVIPILDGIKNRGDAAVREFTAQFDGVDLSPERFLVSQSDMDEAVQSLSPELSDAIRTSLDNITRFHEAQREPETWSMEIRPGLVAGERTIPIDSVGLYVPRGKGSFPSMMMMSGVPAKVARVRRIVVATPPDANGAADRATLAVARLIGIHEVYALGGVQAIGAMCYGTETVPRVDKIVGPGSGFVMAAKQLVSTEIDTGMPAGPSEAIVFADDSVDVETAAVDLLIEAEHGPDSAAYLVCVDGEYARRVAEIIPKLIADLPEERRGYCEAVFRENGGVVLAADVEDAVNFINGFAPEHLQLMVREPWALVPQIRTAGEVLIGPFTPGTLANYSIGPNAILPTSGFARTASALSVRDFTRKMSFAEATEAAFLELAPKTLALTEYEGFAAHARALTLRLNATDVLSEK